jgi:ribosomal-protein-alanine N-acetyltransferase
MLKNTIIRTLTRRDVAAVAVIETLAFYAPWTTEELEACRNSASQCVVFEQGITVIGYLIYGMEHGRLTIRRMAVHPQFKRQGVGFQLLAFLMQKLTGKRDCVYISIGLKWHTAIKFFSKHGFRATGKIKHGNELYDDDMCEFKYESNV